MIHHSLLSQTICLSINVDWFKVYDHSQYSAGPIYLVILNLPRHERYKDENVRFDGIIPGPKEPKYNAMSLTQCTTSSLVWQNM